MRRPRVQEFCRRIFFSVETQKKNINLIRHFGMYIWLRLLFTFTEKPCLLGILISSNIKSLTLCGCDIMANFKLSNFSVSQIEKKFLKIALARNEILSVCFFFKDVKTIPPKLNSSRAPHNWNAWQITVISKTSFGQIWIQYGRYLIEPFLVRLGGMSGLFGLAIGILAWIRLAKIRTMGWPNSTKCR